MVSRDVSVEEGCTASFGFVGAGTTSAPLLFQGGFLSSEDQPPFPESLMEYSGKGGISSHYTSPQRPRGRWPTGRALGWMTLALSLSVILSSCGPLGRRVRLVVNGTEQEIYTSQATVMDVLEEVNLIVYPEDMVRPVLTTKVASGQTIIFDQARQAMVAVDGQVHHLRTQASNAWDLLQTMGITLRPQDRLLVNGQRLPIDRQAQGQQATGSPLSASTRRVTSRGPRPISFPSPAPLYVAVVRAVPLHVTVRQAGKGGEEDVDLDRTDIHSAAATVGEALYEAGISIFRGDQVEPSPDSPLTAGVQVGIQRALPLAIQVDGITIHTRTQDGTVADVLAQERISLWDQDYVIPAESATLSGDMAIRVVRVREETIVEQEAIPFETAWAPDAELELDQRRVDNPGQPGIIARRFRIRYEDGASGNMGSVVIRTQEEEWRAQDPQPKTIAYGTKIVSRQVSTSDGPRSYWRKVRVLVTSYTAATSGKSRDHPEYGITRLGWQMRWGIIAVDPRVVNFGTQLYVTGYGVGVSADTGGKILGRRIDLGYDESNLKLWYKWMDVYLLDPPPPRNQIRWVLPDWPKE